MQVMECVRWVLFATLVIWGAAGAVGLVLYGLDWLAGWLHRRWAKRRDLRP